MHQCQTMPCLYAQQYWRLYSSIAQHFPFLFKAGILDRNRVENSSFCFMWEGEHVSVSFDTPLLLLCRRFNPWGYHRRRGLDGDGMAQNALDGWLGTRPTPYDERQPPAVPFNPPTIHTTHFLNEYWYFEKIDPDSQIGKRGRIMELHWKSPIIKHDKTESPFPFTRSILCWLYNIIDVDVQYSTKGSALSSAVARLVRSTDSILIGVTYHSAADAGHPHTDLPMMRLFFFMAAIDCRY